MDKTPNPYESAYLREKSARLQAEQLLEDKSRELFLKNKALEESYKTLQQQQSVLVQNEKMATLGTLSAGIAHEINNPLAFVLSNLTTLVSYDESFKKLYECNQRWLEHDQLPPPLRDELNALVKKEDLGYIREDVEELLGDTIDGIERVRDIVVNLKSFSRTQEADRVEADLLDGLRSTLKLLDNQLRYSVTVVQDLQPLPKITCNPNQLNQVFLNLIINAQQATEGRPDPTITISSEYADNHLVIRVGDNGCGMSEKVRKEIFVPFFTTKPIGKGTGMGLSIAYGIVQDHKGRLTVQSEEGVGTVFEVRIPNSQL